MTIGMCTSCGTGGNDTQAMRERQQMSRADDLITEPWLVQDRLETRGDFQPDPSRFLDIVA